MRFLPFVFLALFSFSSCTESDPCEDITCVEGFCNDGTCDCSEGWTGAACDVLLTPSSVTIKRITLLEYNYLRDDNTVWDINSSGPDLCIYIEEVDNYRSDCKEEAIPGVEYTWNTNLVWPDGAFWFRLEDRDGPNDYELMNAMIIPPRWDSDISELQVYESAISDMRVELLLGYEY